MTDGRPRRGLLRRYAMKLSQDHSPARQRRIVSIRTRLERFLERRGYSPVATPMLESTDLYLKKSGGELAARMYSFTDPSGRRVSLRPEFTSSVVQAFVNGSLKGPLPQRWVYSGPVFRYESGSGDGEFEQLGAELLGSGGAAADAEVLALAAQGLTALGVTGHKLRIGHMGVVASMLDSLGLSERARVFMMGSLAKLRSGEESAADVRGKAVRLGLLSPESTKRLARIAREMPAEDASAMVHGFIGDGMDGGTGQRTPEDILRRYLKKLRDVGAPDVFDRALSLSVELAGIAGAPKTTRGKLSKLAAKFSVPASVLQPVDDVLAALSRYDLHGVPVILDLAAARGIAYYTGAVFDVEHSRIKGLPSLGGGGRYDGLVGALGGRKQTPAMGFAFALDRISQLLPADFAADEDGGQTRVLVTAQETAFEEAVATAERLRAQGIPAELDLESKSDAEAAKYAQQRGIQTIMRVGQDGRVAEQFI